MIRKEDKLRPTQPFLVLCAEEFQQEVYLRQGISHFYGFSVKEDREITLVPAACIDIYFVYRDGEMESFISGTCTALERKTFSAGSHVFGVRFMPGHHPAGIVCEMRELVDKTYPLQNLLRKQEMIDLIFQEDDFYQRIRVFLQEYTKLEKIREKPYGKKEIAMSVRDMAYESAGRIRVGDMAQATGYSQRYINKVFKEEMGMAPKTFCEIIRFQKVLEFLNYGAPEKMTEAAVDWGYYDQSQFIKNFKRFCGMTPKKYLNLIRDAGYRQKISQRKNN